MTPLPTLPVTTQFRSLMEGLFIHICVQVADDLDRLGVGIPVMAALRPRRSRVARKSEKSRHRARQRAASDGGYAITLKVSFSLA